MKFQPRFLENIERARNAVPAAADPTTQPISVKKCDFLFFRHADSLDDTCLLESPEGFVAEPSMVGVKVSVDACGMLGVNFPQKTGIFHGGIIFHGLLYPCPSVDGSVAINEHKPLFLFFWGLENLGAVSVE